MFELYIKYKVRSTEAIIYSNIITLVYTVLAVLQKKATCANFQQLNIERYHLIILFALEVTGNLWAEEFRQESVCSVHVFRLKEESSHQFALFQVIYHV